MGKTDTLGNRLLKNSIALVSKTICFLPRPVTLFMATISGTIIYYIYRVSKYRNFIANNIKQSLPISSLSAKKMAKRHIIKFIKNISDLFWLEKINTENIQKIVTIKNIEYYNQALESNKGIIFVSAHYGCWEMIGAAISLLLNNKLNVMVQKASNPVFDQFFIDLRSKYGVNTHYNDKSISALRNLYRALENNECLGFLLDQHGEAEDTFGEFFGNIVSIPSGPAHISYTSKAPIVPVFIRRKNDENHEILFFPPIYCGDNDKEREIHEVSQKIYNVIESYIKENPEEWLWTYERWNKLSLDAREIATHMKELRDKEVTT